MTSQWGRVAGVRDLGGRSLAPPLRTRRGAISGGAHPGHHPYDPRTLPFERSQVGGRGVGPPLTRLTPSSGRENDFSHHPPPPAQAPLQADDGDERREERHQEAG